MTTTLERPTSRDQYVQAQETYYLRAAAPAPQAVEPTVRGGFHSVYESIAVPQFVERYDTTVTALHILNEPVLGAVKPYYAAWERIRSLGSLEDGWSGPGSIAPTQAAITDGETFTRLNILTTVGHPNHIGFASDGELVISWARQNLVLEVSIHGDRTYSYYAEVDGTRYYGDDVPIKTQLPALIRTTINSAR